VMTDTNGLYQMRARFYHPELRRFVNQDPVFLGGIAESQSLNRFAFVTGEPVSLVDPFGLEGLDPRTGTTLLDSNFLKSNTGKPDFNFSKQLKNYLDTAGTATKISEAFSNPLKYLGFKNGKLRYPNVPPIKFEISHDFSKKITNTVRSSKAVVKSVPVIGKAIDVAQEGIGSIQNISDVCGGDEPPLENFAKISAEPAALSLRISLKVPTSLAKAGNAMFKGINYFLESNTLESHIQDADAGIRMIEDGIDENITGEQYRNLRNEALDKIYDIHK